MTDQPRDDRGRFVSLPDRAADVARRRSAGRPHGARNGVVGLA